MRKSILYLALFLFLAVSAQADCLSQLANSIKPGGGFQVTTDDSVHRPWKWDSSSSDWKKGKVLGFAPGAAQGGNGTSIVLFPNAMGGGAVCTPGFLAKAFKILAHEILHFCCPPHSGTPGADIWGEDKPEQPGSPPDCNDLNYAMHTADAICDEIARVAACCANEGDGSPGSGGSEGGGGGAGGTGGTGGTTGGGTTQEEEFEEAEEEEEEECEGLTDDEGNPIEGLERENLKEYCEGLADEHQGMQDKYNTPENAATAFDCACGQPPWTPGAGYSCCPGFPAPAGGCQGSAAETYPNNEVIPECSADCSDCE